MSTDGKAIEVDGLTKRFGTFVAVDHIHFTVDVGEVFGLLGPNGAGKTTLIRMLTTLTPPTEGVARVAGFDVAKEANKVRNSIGVIPQALTSDPELTAEENMMIYAKLYSVPGDRRAGLVRDLLEAVDLTKFSKALVQTFSGVVFHVQTRDADALRDAIDCNFDAAFNRERQFVHGNLIALGKIGVKVIFSGEARMFLNLAVQCHRSA